MGRPVKNRGATLKPTGESGHYDLRGDKEELKRYLVPTFRAEVEVV
ncbi:MAG: hypothetical protein M3R06_00360 [Chloroflexota bacterium]|nr:hypothetical protein [Chloroflexota bacterium]